ncbi:hypothetical protein CKO28_02400 [Rhodovibrio sodomensis]|uniref:Uncharacterized protein n=1 Tax=Rhodovibrio sodomensis TaxID=1088 RepID=A0ABS1DB05_9PROT|nr:hypothetical protein [Rhodovibrio sodomensis]MBK1666893.1 hypothetical protein [Rhodovibrio sodomensis]
MRAHRDSTPPRRRLAYMPAGALLLASFLGLGALSLRPPAGVDQVAAIFPPGVGFAEVQSRLAGTRMRLVRNGLADWIAIVDLGGSAPERLYDRGAWLIGDPQALGGCLVRPVTAGR